MTGPEIATADDARGPGEPAAFAPDHAGRSAAAGESAEQQSPAAINARQRELVRASLLARPASR